MHPDRVPGKRCYQPHSTPGKSFFLVSDQAADPRDRQALNFSGMFECVEAPCEAVFYHTKRCAEGELARRRRWYAEQTRTIYPC